MQLFSSFTPWLSAEMKYVKPQHLVLPFLFCSLGSYRNHSVPPPAIINLKIYDGRIQLLSRLQLLGTLGTTAHQASLSFTVCLSLLKLISIESVMPSNHHILCHPLLFLPSVFPSIRVFSKESALCVKWPKYWSFSTSPSNEYSELISFTIGWLDLLAVQGTLKSLLQYHSSNALVLSLLYGPTLTSILDYCKNHSFDYTDLCWQSDVSDF